MAATKKTAAKNGKKPAAKINKAPAEQAQKKPENPGITKGRYVDESCKPISGHRDGSV